MVIITRNAPVSALSRPGLPSVSPLLVRAALLLLCFFSIGAHSFAGVITTFSDGSLNGSKVVDFETTATGQYPTLAIGDVTFIGTGGALRIDNGYSGLFNTQGRYLDNNAGITKSFDLVFSSPVSAVAFNVGSSDVDATLTVYSDPDRTTAIGSTSIPITNGSNDGTVTGFKVDSGEPIIRSARITAPGDWVFYDNFRYLIGASAPSAPSVNTLAADAVTGGTATLHGTVSSNKLATSVYFEFSADPALGSGVQSTSAQTVAGDAVNTVVSQPISGLTPETTYFFRAVAKNSLGTTQGAVVSFLPTDTSAAYRWSGNTPNFTIGSGLTFGSEFNVITACKLSHLGVYDHNQDGLSAPVQVGLWDLAGHLLASTIVSSSDPLKGNSRYHALDTPVSLAAGTHYVVGAYYAVRDFYGYTPPGYTTDPRISYQGYALQDGSFAFPTFRGTGVLGYFGATFLIGNPVTAPFADAGADLLVYEGSTVSLSGLGSHDTNAPARSITYTWTQLAGPAAVNLTGLNTATPSFTAPSVPAAGAALVFQLSVSNGSLATTDTVTVNVGNVNTPPVADAGPDQAVTENTNVMLDGTLSSDADGDPLTLHWRQVPGVGPSVELSDSDTGRPTFTAFPVTAAQGMVDVKFELVVNDGLVSSGPSQVTIHVKNVNDPPAAVAGPNQSVDELDLVTLDGTGSVDPDSDALTFSWKQIPSGTVALNGDDTAMPTFRAPEQALGGRIGGTTLTFQLTVTDPKQASSTSTVNVQVNNVNHRPLADAGPDQKVPSNSTVTLDGSQSADVDGDTLTYQWEQTAGPAVVLSATDTATAGLTAPVAGPGGTVLKFRLTVDDGFGGVAHDEVVVNVAYINHPPTAKAGNPRTVNEGATALLVGTASDPDGNPLTISWTQISGPAVTILDGSTLKPSFVAPLVSRAEADVMLRLTVDDGYEGSASSDTIVHIANIDHPPSAQAPANMSVAEGTPVSLIGQGSDPDSEELGELAYSWRQLSGPAVTLTGKGATVHFDAPVVTGKGDPNAKAILVFRLTTVDPNGLTASDDVTVVVTNVDHSPTAVAGGNLVVNENTSVTLNGSASSDPDGDALTYSWVQIAGPSVTLSDPNTAYPYFTAPFTNAAGTTLKFQLTVKDGFGGSSSDYATVTVSNRNDPPISTNARPSTATLWPPDHSMVKVSILGIVDPNDNASITITRVTQNEPTNGQGDGDTPIDAIINCDGTVLLRAERSGKRNGRVYHVYFVARDFEGSSSGMVTVCVPKNKKTDAVVDGGVVYDSTR